MSYRYSSIERERLGRAVAYFTTHLDKRITTDALEKCCMMSRNKIDHWFRQMYGETSVRYFYRQKMEKARALVLETDLLMPEISAQLGYGQPNSFHYAFKKYWGETPGTLRMRHHHL